MRAVQLAALEGERPTIPRSWDGALAELLRTSWAAEPRQRPSYASVLEQLHAWHVSEFKASYDDTLRKGPAAPGGGACCALM